MRESALPETYRCIVLFEPESLSVLWVARMNRVYRHGLIERITSDGFRSLGCESQRIVGIESFFSCPHCPQDAGHLVR